MAKFFPPEPLPATPASERKVFEALRNLDKEWRVFHSVEWQSERAGREGDGEADFVLLHPRRGLIVLEVKGGEIAIEEGQWASLNRKTNQVNRIKNPFEQAKASKYALLKHLDALFPPKFGAQVMHGAVLPDVPVDDFLGLNAPRAITIDAGDLVRIEQAIDRLTGHWGASSDLSSKETRAITNLLAPTTSLKVTLKARVANALTEIIHLTYQQIETLKSLRRNRKALILGPAGSGKTVLAMERCRQLVRDGFEDVLLVCFNRPLSDAIREQMRDVPQVEVMTFHSLCFASAARARLAAPQDPPESWWDVDAPLLLLAAADAASISYSAIVIDEGQDFAGDWIDALAMLLKDQRDSPMYVFADDVQAVYRRDWKVPESWPVFELTMNCRTTRQIARRAGKMFGRDTAVLGANGPAPQFITVPPSGSASNVISQVTYDLIESEHFTPNQCVVLSTSRNRVRDLYQSLAGDHPFVELGKKGIVAETVHRFKGLEADVIVLDLSGQNGGEDELALAYVGMTRARAMLFVLGSPAMKNSLGWTD